LPFYLLSCAGIVYAAVRRSREQVLLLVSFLPYLILTTFASWVVIRYTLPMLPALCVLAASAVVDALCARAVRRLIAAIVTVLAIAWTLLADAAYANMEAQRNVRDECGDWIAAHAKPGSSLASVWQYDGDVYLSPTVSGDLELFGLVPKANDPEQLTRDGGFDFIAVNAEVYGALERLGDRHPNPGIREFQHQLQRGPYRLVAQCAKPVRLLGVDFANAFSALDYAIVNPGIRVYQHD
jgi:hypothetical protein